MPVVASMMMSHLGTQERSPVYALMAIRDSLSEGIARQLPALSFITLVETPVETGQAIFE
jgi:hypothetical protein